MVAFLLLLLQFHCLLLVCSGVCCFFFFLNLLGNYPFFPSSFTYQNRFLSTVVINNHPCFRSFCYDFTLFHFNCIFSGLFFFATFSVKRFLHYLCSLMIFLLIPVNLRLVFSASSSILGPFSCSLIVLKVNC